MAVFTDVHGNYAALQAVLKEDIERNEVEHIYCLGDMIAIGQETNQVLETLFSRNDISMVTGNHDESILAIVEGKEHPVSHSHAKTHHEWIASRMDPVFVPKLKSLPRILEGTYVEKNLLMLHYHMEESKRAVHISEDPFASVGKDPSLEQISAFYLGSTAEIICFGHDHKRYYFATASKIYLNPGALGCYELPIARYAILEIIDSEVNVLFKEVPYNNKNFLLNFRSFGLPEGEFLLTVFHGNQHLNYM
ncbi:metallophosphoesterase family protein [Paenibacillus sp. MAH-36]|uniref:Metallophosphoesterase family protein n=1 Tax=Paenibacillus violae TaxID=3077234 RepID=A0ABU3RR49_9BACL|nr:metallophosphoesterase family protein [Paenibacillus sp. PFR10]MDU0206454.1 metallophosphoesterase family protein [Paenibacillus sp. PFR10]